jgi:uracil DNA glycosylase
MKKHHVLKSVHPSPLSAHRVSDVLLQVLVV